MKRLSWKEIKEISATRHYTKGDLMKDCEIDCTFDYALPQQWLERLVAFAWQNMIKFDGKTLTFDAQNGSELYSIILGTTVWVYPEGKPFSGCSEAQSLIDKFMEY